MTKVNLYKLSGVSEKTEFPQKYQGEIKPSLLAQAVRVYEDRVHPGLSRVKTRSEVAKSTRKIYKQKGTGGARHGAKSAPIFVGGGVAHGPKGVKRLLSLSKKLVKKSLISSLGAKIASNELVMIDGLSKVSSTKEVANLLSKVFAGENVKRGSKVTYVYPQMDVERVKYFRNIKCVKCVSFSGLNAREVLFGGLLVIDMDCFTATKTTEKKSVKTVEKKEVKKTAAKKVKKETK